MTHKNNINTCVVLGAVASFLLINIALCGEWASSSIHLAWWLFRWVNKRFKCGVGDAELLL